MGYIASRGKTGQGSASVTLEYQNADFAISRFALALGDTTAARYLLARSAKWRNLFDAETRYIRPRGEDGSFLSGFTPGKETGFVEGNAAQYTWMVPYNLTEVITAVGGPEAARQRLDDYFSQYYDYKLKNGPTLLSETSRASGIRGFTTGRGIRGERKKPFERLFGICSHPARKDSPATTILARHPLGSYLHNSASTRRYRA